MPAQTEIIDMLTELANVGTVGLLSPAVDLAASFAGGKELKRYLDGSALMNMNVLISGKGDDQIAVANRLCEICDALTRKNFRTFPKTDEWEIRRVAVGTPAAPKGKSEDGTWFYACVLSVNYYQKNYRRN
ncbi:MAG: hypothetical protein OSJ54_12100 [Oscillospiraceae bacterium]|nr:hypothetical protein [Oscillospiraceae bacterium]